MNPAPGPSTATASVAIAFEGGPQETRRQYFYIPAPPAGFAHAVLFEYEIAKQSPGSTYYYVAVEDVRRRNMGSVRSFTSSGLASGSVVGRVAASGFGFASGGYASIAAQNFAGPFGGTPLLVTGTLRIFQLPSSEVGGGAPVTDFEEIDFPNDPCEFDPLGIGVEIPPSLIYSTADTNPFGGPRFPACVAGFSESLIRRVCFGTEDDRATYIGVITGTPRPGDEVLWLGADDETPVRP